MKRNAIYKQYTCTKCGKVYTSARCYRDSAGEVVCLECKREDDSSLGKSKTFTSKTYTCFHCGKPVTSMKVYRDKAGNPVCYECKKAEDTTYRSPELKTYTYSHCGKLLSLVMFIDMNKAIQCALITCTKCGTGYCTSHPIYDFLWGGGGKEKLIKNFIDTYKPKSLISYCDKSKFSGNSYLKCGFVLDSCTPWNYCYVKYDSGMKVLNRVSAQKFKLKKLLGADNFDPSLTASQNMSNNGWTKFTTLGTYKFVYRG